MNKTKTLKPVLILSLAANAVLLLGSATGLFSLGKPPDDASARAAAVASKRAPADKTLSPEAAKAATALLSIDDPTALRDRLRALGLPDDMVRAVVRANINSHYAARLREIDKEALAASQKIPYWRPNPAGVDYSGFTAEQAKEWREIYRNQQEQIRQVLGNDGITSINQITYSTFLPAGKAAQLADIDNDYSDLRQQIIIETAGFRMPGDGAKLKLLDDEKQRDVQALLTPDELAEKKLRTSSGLQHTFAAFDGTEEEYKAIFALQNPVDEKYDTATAMYGGVNMQDFYRERSAVQAEIDTQIKDMLGDERYADYQRAQRMDYKSLLAAAQRFDLAPETVSQTYQARDAAVAEVSRISGDKSLSAEQKTQAYAALAEQTTAQIRASLGNDIGDAYINNALGWLKTLPNGGTVHVSSDGGDVYVVPPRPGKNGK